MLNKLFRVLNSITILSILFSFNLFAQLKSPDNQADYIVITPAQFETTLQPFVEWRQQKGLNMKVVDLQQIYTEFPDSGAQFSIRDFVSYALTFWKDPKPKYVLLVGETKLIPAYMVASSFAADTSFHEDSVAIDEWYSVNSYDQDIRPEIDLGRFPVNNNTELENIISKTIYCEDSLTMKSYSKDFLFLTDKKDSSSFNSEANQFISSTLPERYSKETIFAGNDSSVEITRRHLFNALNSGCLYFSYYGHGAPGALSQYNLFTYGDIDSLKENNLPFIFTAAACSQNFNVPNDSSIVKRLIVFPGGGAVATIATAGLNFLSQGSLFLSTFYKDVFDNPGISIGDAFLKAKLNNEPLISSADVFPRNTDSITRRYTLLGDPALKIPTDVVAAINNGSNQIPNGFVLEQNYPNPFNPSTMIQYSIPIYSFVSVKVYDILGNQVATLVYGYKNPGIYSVKFSPNNLSSGIYFYQIQVLENNGEAKILHVKKMVYLK